MGGLLDSPRHSLELQKFVLGAGSLGQKKPVADGDRVTVRGNLQPLSSEERIARGLQLEVLYRFSTRNWPGDYLSRAYFDGYEWEAIAEPERRRMSSRTAHAVVILKRGARDGSGQ